MKIIFTLLIFCCLSLQADVLKLLEKAKEDKKLVYLLVTKTGCPWCYAMEKKVISSYIVQKYLKSYVFLQVNASIDKTLPKKLKVNFFPTSYIINPSDNNFIIKKFIGYVGIKSLSRSLQENLDLYQ
jgi:thiol-disulfide isomerase/thioredoxin